MTSVSDKSEYISGCMQPHIIQSFSSEILKYNDIHLPKHWDILVEHADIMLLPHIFHSKKDLLSMDALLHMARRTEDFNILQGITSFSQLSLDVILTIHQNRICNEHLRTQLVSQKFDFIPLSVAYEMRTLKNADSSQYDLLKPYLMRSIHDCLLKEVVQILVKEPQLLTNTIRDAFFTQLDIGPRNDDFYEFIHTSPIAFLQTILERLTHLPQRRVILGFINENTNIVEKDKKNLIQTFETQLHEYLLQMLVQGDVHSTIYAINHDIELILPIISDLFKQLNRMDFDEGWSPFIQGISHVELLQRMIQTIACPANKHALLHGLSKNQTVTVSEKVLLNQCVEHTVNQHLLQLLEHNVAAAITAINNDHELVNAVTEANIIAEFYQLDAIPEMTSHWQLFIQIIPNAQWIQDMIQRTTHHEKRRLLQYIIDENQNILNEQRHQLKQTLGETIHKCLQDMLAQNQIQALIQAIQEDPELENDKLITEILHHVYNISLSPENDSWHPWFTHGTSVNIMQRLINLLATTTRRATIIELLEDNQHLPSETQKTLKQNLDSAIQERLRVMLVEHRSVVFQTIDADPGLISLLITTIEENKPSLAINEYIALCDRIRMDFNQFNRLKSCYPHYTIQNVLQQTSSTYLIRKIIQAENSSTAVLRGFAHLLVENKAINATDKRNLLVSINKKCTQLNWGPLAFFMGATTPTTSERSCFNPVNFWS